ncbi:Signal transduction histidine kinase [Verrucomicrobium sp. GAS474]|uniref:hypothetical protein n=1 Tax=Verrucomicrobium sp. GAS474 TaxID=1882831 RepID=UPI00087DB4BB|nr:hypothetical protein [Verrucomicrobium sp. GAS474]SDT97941.1 Signal transduction histidine kinase [Verrucomicrobium sp. GAS474]
MADTPPNIASLLSRKQLGFALLLVILTTLLVGGGQAFRLLSNGQESAALLAHIEAASLLSRGPALPEADRLQAELPLLGSDPFVTGVAVYNAEGDLRAQYVRDGGKPLPDKQLLAEEQVEVRTSTLRESATALLLSSDGHPVGSLYLRRDNGWAGFLPSVLIAFAFSLVLATILASSYASKLGPQLAKPLAAVANTTLSRLQAELESTLESRAAEKAEFASLRDALKQAQDRGNASALALGAKEAELAALKQRPSPAGGDGKALIRLAQDLILLPASPVRDAALALTETAAAVTAESEPSSHPLDPAALAAEAVLAARIRASAKKSTVAFDAFPGIPATLPGDGPLLLRAVTLLLNDAIERTSGGEIVLIAGVVKNALRFEFRDTGAAQDLPPAAEQAVKSLGATLKGKATEAGTVRWFDLALE